MTTDLQSLLILFKDRRPNSCYLDQIYDPDVDGPAYIDMPKLIPAEGAAVFDRDNEGIIYYVKSVNAQTLKTTVAPARLLPVAESDEAKILSYGNDLFTLYYDHREDPTKLLVDGKLRLFGASLAEYRLSRLTEDGNKEYISAYINSDGVPTGERIPLAVIAPGSPIKYCTNCHTFHNITDGDQILLEVFSSEGILMASVVLFVKQATILNDLLSTNTVITGMTATANQMDGVDFYLHQRQEVSELVISPIVQLSDGSEVRIPIDNRSCFVYGLNDFIPSFPGQKQKILIKKFLGRSQISPIQETDGFSRFISIERFVTVLANESLDGIKVSIIPMWNPGSNKYDLKYIAYSDRRDKVYDVTPYVTPLNSYNTGLFNTQQEILFSVDLTPVFGTSATVEYRQSTFANFKHYNEFERYIFKDTVDDNYAYGVEYMNRRRPVLHYDADLQKFFIPTSRFPTKESFVENFYTMARAPYDPKTEMGPITPTHFTIRDKDTLNTILAAPIPVDEFSQAWSITLNDPQNFVGSNVIVEFLQEVSDTFLIIYGVPVDVFNSPTGYNL